MIYRAQNCVFDVIVPDSLIVLNKDSFIHSFIHHTFAGLLLTIVYASYAEVGLPVYNAYTYVPFMLS